MGTTRKLTTLLKRWLNEPSIVIGLLICACNFICFLSGLDFICITAFVYNYDTGLFMTGAHGQLISHKHVIWDTTINSVLTFTLHNMIMMGNEIFALLVEIVVNILAIIHDVNAYNDASTPQCLDQ